MKKSLTQPMVVLGTPKLLGCRLQAAGCIFEVQLSVSVWWRGFTGCIKLAKAITGCTCALQRGSENARRRVSFQNRST